MTLREYQEAVGKSIPGGMRRADVFCKGTFEIGERYGEIMAGYLLPYSGKPMDDEKIQSGIRGILKGLAEMCFAREWDLQDIVEGKNVTTKTDSAKHEAE